MLILFVCSGNQCRSPLGELAMRNALAKHSITDIVTDSAGILYLPPHPIDPLMLALMREDHISGEGFLSKPLTSQLSQSADIILCFEKHQVASVISQTPRVARRTFLFQDFANACGYLHANGQLQHSSLPPSSRLLEIMDQIALIRPFLPVANDTCDPHGKSSQVFSDVHAEILNGIDCIVRAIL